MNSNQTQCQPLGGQPRAIARIEYRQLSGTTKRTTVVTFDRVQVCSLGDNRPILFGRIGGIEPINKPTSS